MKNIITLLLVLTGLAATAQVTNNNTTIYTKSQTYRDTCFYEVGDTGTAGYIMTNAGGGEMQWTAPADACTCDTVAAIVGNFDTINAHIGNIDTMQTDVIFLSAGGGGPTVNTLPLLRDTATGQIATDTCMYWSTCGNAGTDPAVHFIGTTDAQDFVLKTSATEAMRIDAAQNIGIGVVLPTLKLDVFGGTSITAWAANASLHFGINENEEIVVFEQDTTDGLHTYYQGFSIGSGLFSQTTSFSLNSDVPNTNIGFTQTSDTAKWQLRCFLNTNSPSFAITVLKSTNVGIGTVSPTAQLHVVGSSDTIATAIFEQTDSGGVITEINTTYGGEVTRYHLKVHLDSTQIQNANSSPIDIGLPASGAGYYYRVKSFDCKFTYGTTAFTSTELYIGASTGLNAQYIWDIPLTVTETVFADSHPIENLSTNLVENDILTIQSDGDSATGDSSIDCYITVEKVKL